MKAFQREERIQNSTPELDQAEMSWWNRYSPLIERIWGLPDVLCRETRSGYIADVRKIFHSYESRRPVRIAEIACGSGWPGRLLADENTQVTGIDFSEEQISLARRKGRESGARFCTYQVQDVNQLEEIYRGVEFDGIFIHCGLHHLAGNELKNFSRAIAQVRKGFTVVLVEPIYPERQDLIGKGLRLVSEVFYRTFLKIFLSRETLDPLVTKQTTSLVSEADNRGWFLSPKEMPFTLPEIDDLFGGSFEMKEVRPVSHFALRLGQYLATLKDQDRAAAIGIRWLPAFRFLDRMLGRTGILSRLSNDYMFTLVAMVKK